MVRGVGAVAVAERRYEGVLLDVDAVDHKDQRQQRCRARTTQFPSTAPVPIETSRPPA